MLPVRYRHKVNTAKTQEFLTYGAWDFNDPAVNRSSPTYGAFTILSYHVNQHLDLNGRCEWFWDKDGARTGHEAHYGEIAAGLNIMPNPWINFRPEIRGDFASEPSFGSVRSTDRKRSQLTVAFDIVLKFH